MYQTLIFPGYLILVHHLTSTSLLRNIKKLEDRCTQYQEQLKSDVADLRNIGGRGAGSITAGLFLQHFAGDTPWVHLDVAGTAYSETDLVVMPKGPTGTPVRTFVEFVRGRAR
jgi:leucyl aminopeptidase